MPCLGVVLHLGIVGIPGCYCMPWGHCGVIIGVWLMVDSCGQMQGCGDIASCYCNLLLWELSLVSNKVNKHTVYCIGSVAGLVSLLFCMSGDPEVKCSISYIHNTFIYALVMQCIPVESDL